MANSPLGHQQNGTSPERAQREVSDRLETGVGVSQAAANDTSRHQRRSALVVIDVMASTSIAPNGGSACHTSEILCVDDVTTL